MIEGLSREQIDFSDEPIVQTQNFGDLIRIRADGKEREYIKVREYSISSSEDNEIDGDVAAAKATFYLFGDTPYCNVNDIEVKINNLRKNSGIGSALMRRIESDAVDLGCKQIKLLARALPTDDHPYGFYKKLGYVNSDGLDELEVEKRIKVDNTVGISMVKQLAG